MWHFDISSLFPELKRKIEDKNISIFILTYSNYIYFYHQKRLKTKGIHKMKAWKDLRKNIKI